ncbi:MAG: glycosyltransferase family 4 protein [Solirubrobacteraceae bacterium]
MTATLTRPVVVTTPASIDGTGLDELLDAVTVAGGLLRIAVPDGDLGVAARFDACGSDHAATRAPIEIVNDAIEVVARPGDFVLAPSRTALRLAELGCLPLDGPVLPSDAHNAVGHLAAATGWTRIEWIAECRMGSGYADEARMFLQALDTAGLEPALTGYANPAPRVALGSETERLLRRCEARRPAEQTAIGVWHEKPIDPRHLQGRRRRVCRTMFETDALPREWVAPLNGFDRIWVPTPFNLETFERAGVRPDLMRVLPGTIDLTRFTAQAPPRRLPGAEGFTFLSNFTFQERKGWRELLQAYVLEFAGDEGVTLALKLSTGFVSAQEIRARVDAFIEGLGVPASRRPRIVIAHQEVSDIEMAGFYTGCDAYVSPTRGEGWGRPMMEALACGCPTIASRWSGQLSFLDDAHAWLVDGEVVPVPDDIDNETFRGQRWFAPDLDALRGAMRAVASDPAAARARAAAARPWLEAEFGLPAIAERLADLALEALSCP